MALWNKLKLSFMLMFGKKENPSVRKERPTQMVETLPVTRSDLYGQVIQVQPRVGLDKLKSFSFGLQVNLPAPNKDELILGKFVPLIKVLMDRKIEANKVYDDQIGNLMHTPAYLDDRNVKHETLPLNKHIDFDPLQFGEFSYIPDLIVIPSDDKTIIQERKTYATIGSPLFSWMSITPKEFCELETLKQSWNDAFSLRMMKLKHALQDAHPDDVVIIKVIKEPTLGRGMTNPEIYLDATMEDVVRLIDNLTPNEYKELERKRLEKYDD